MSGSAAEKKEFCNRVLLRAAAVKSWDKEWKMIHQAEGKEKAFLSAG